MTLAPQFRSLLEETRSRRHPVVLGALCILRRNLPERFPGRLDRQERELLRDRLFAALAEMDCCREASFLKAELLDPAEMACLAEFALLPERQDLADDRRGLVLPAGARHSVRVGDGDHLCLQGHREGWELEEIWADVDSLDAALEERLDFAFSEEFGYLTASPRRAGTALQCRALLHLTALTLRGELPRLLRALDVLHGDVRLHGDGEGPGTLLELANSRSMGMSEDELVDGFAEVVNKLSAFEDRAREALLTEARSLLEDRVWTAYGQLRYGRLLSAQTAAELLGTLSLGCRAGILEVVDYQGVQSMWRRVGDGGLQLLAGETLDPAARDARRAEQLRRWLADLETAERKG